MRTPFRLRELITGIAAGLLIAAVSGSSRVGPGAASGFAFTVEAVVPGSPEATFDALTGDISGWWDHTFAESPERLFIEPRPGGGFYEIFDESGDGVRHAVVTAARRGELMRMEGPLGLAGHALLMVHTYALEPADGGSTRLTVTVRATGEIEEGWAETVESVWNHFIHERFVPYVEARSERYPG